MVTEQSRTLEALQTAIQMEVDGKKFYQSASRASTNEGGRKLFQMLAEEEDIHRRKFEEIYQTLRTWQSWPSVDLSSASPAEFHSVFAGASKDIHPADAELTAVQTAMDMENKTYDFYKERAAAFSFVAEKKFYESVAGQERMHHAVLLDYYEYLKNPVDWFTMKERHSLDGG
jgi:rubrerythrin